MSLAKLPTELLCEILDYATDNPLRHNECRSIPTFSAAGENVRENMLDDALKMKAALCRVSRIFRTVSDAFLYEDIHVRHGSDALVALLEESQRPHHLHHPCSAIGCRVRRVCLYPAEEDIAQIWAGIVNHNAYRILRCCPHVEVLTRKNAKRLQPWPEEDALPGLDIPSPELTRLFTADDLQLPSLRRVDWNNEPYSAQTDSQRMSLPLPQFVWTLPSLQDLSINGTSFPNVS